MAAAATSRSTPSGTGTTRCAGLLTTVDSLPLDWHQATRSPTETSVTPAPTAVTVPAPSSPRTNGVVTG